MKARRKANIEVTALGPLRLVDSGPQIKTYNPSLSGIKAIKPRYVSA